MRIEELISDLLKACETKRVVVVEEGHASDSTGREFTILRKNSTETRALSSLLDMIEDEFQKMGEKWKPKKEHKPSKNDVMVIAMELEKIKSSFSSLFAWAEVCAQKLELPSLIQAAGIGKLIEQGHEVVSMNINSPTFQKTRTGIRSSVTINLELTGASHDTRPTEEPTEQPERADQRSGRKAGRKTERPGRKSHSH